jgi:hypothetical protein
MDFRFIAAGIVVAAIGFVSGSMVFAAPARPADPAIAGLAAERVTINAAAAELPPLADLPALPKPPKQPAVVRQVAAAVPVSARRTTRVVARTLAKPKPQRQRGHGDDGDDHDDDHGGDD